MLAVKLWRTPQAGPVPSPTDAADLEYLIEIDPGPAATSPADPPS